VTFHVKRTADAVDRALAWLEVEPRAEVRASLAEYADWVRTEGRDAGAIGPSEVPRLADRHIGDSLCFAAGFTAGLPNRVVDVGSGIGLPGVPLAIAFPGVGFTLLDRSGRRTGLLRRVVRILGLENVEVLESDVNRLDQAFPGMTFRASLALPAAMAIVCRSLETDGQAVFGLSRTTPPDEDTLLADAVSVGLSARVVAVPPDILDSPAWLLRMTPQ